MHPYIWLSDELDTQRNQECALLFFPSSCLCSVIQSTVNIIIFKSKSIAWRWCIVCHFIIVRDLDEMNDIKSKRIITIIDQMCVRATSFQLHYTYSDTYTHTTYMMTFCSYSAGGDTFYQINQANLMQITKMVRHVQFVLLRALVHSEHQEQR